MSNGRASIFDSETAADFDVSGFAPRKPASTPKPDKQKIREAAEQRGFASREPEPAPAVMPAIKAATSATPKPAIVADVAPRAVLRRSRQAITGRNKQLNLKVTEETLALFYDVSNAQGWVLGETLEHALAALEEKLAKK